MSALDDFVAGFRDVALETGRQDYQKAHFLERELKGQESDSPMLDSYMASNPGDEAPGEHRSYEPCDERSSQTDWT